MKRFAVVLTNHADYPQRQDKTGLWWTELTHFVEVAEAAGYAMDFISPQGGEIPIDERSLRLWYTDAAARKRFHDADFRHRLRHTLPARETQAADYAAIYFAGGHGCMWDFPQQQDLSALAEGVYQRGGWIAAVCHGVAALLNLRDEHGNFLIQNKKITGFSNVEERLAGLHRTVPFLLEDEIRARGADYRKALLPFTSFVVTDERIITGQNPQSPRAVAQTLIQLLSSSP